MSVVVTPNPLTLPSGTCFSDPQTLLNLFSAYMTVTLPGEFTSVNFGNTEPAVTDRDKPWIRTKVDGAPDYTYVFVDGLWVTLHPLPTGFISLYLGSIASLATYDGGDSNPISATTGPFWEEVSAAAARFLIHPGELPSGTVIGASDTGGNEEVTISVDQMPAHKHGQNVGNQDNSNQVKMAGGPSGGSLSSRKPECNDLSNGTQITTDSVGGGDPVNIIPPYFGIYAIRRTARLYRTPQ